MPRIPESEIEQLKLQVSLLALVESAGIALTRHGKDWLGRCPFHADKTPSLVISPKTNLWHCLGACQAGGSVVDWVMRFENVSFRAAVEWLQREAGAVSDVPAARATAKAASQIPSLAAAVPGAEAAADSGESDAALLSRVVDYYHATLQQSPEALAYLDKRGIASPELIAQFRLGYANRSLGIKLGSVQSREGAARKAQLVRLGMFRDSGHEHLAGSLVIPVITPSGEITEVYGRKLGARLREGTPSHLYLPGPHRGVFNEVGLVGQDEVILCEALIDALTFWCAGYRNVTASYGIEGFTPDLRDAFKRHGVRRVLIAYDADEAGNRAADKLAATLSADGFACYRCRFPKGMDANQYALEVQPSVKSLGIVLDKAEWMGDGPPPERPSITPRAMANHPPLVAAVPTAAKEEIPITAPPVADTVAPAPSAEITERELRLTLGDRVYTVRGIEKNLSYEQLKVWLKVSRGEHFHLDTIELYQAKARSGWIERASVELGVSPEIAKADLGQVLRAVEQRQDAIIRRELKSETSAAPALSEAEQSAALALLRDPYLVERIVADVAAAGVVGEASNALVAYLACVSRKLERPLAILIQSTSAAGKSTLMDAILALMPEGERVHYSAMTGQSLFYLGEQAMKHKILAIAEEEGVRQAAYALKVLQSQGVLTIASTGKDPVTGDLQTKTYTVEGPVMLFLTTTATEVDEELQNRCLVLTIDESREQTAAIQARQRASRTLAGLQAKHRAAAVLATHRAAQTLLRPLAVVNPLAEQLGFATDRVRLRRDQQKYLALIEAIALLHQHQRPVLTTVIEGAPVEYVEVIADDIALANRLAHEVLGRSLDELPPHTRRLLGAIQAFVGARAQAQAITPAQVRFTRRELRGHVALSDTQLRVHLERLVDLEYVLAHAGRNGQRFVYELAFDGAVEQARPHAIGLREVSSTRNLAGVLADLAASDDNLAGRLRPARGPLAAPLRTGETAVTPRVDAENLSLAAVVDENAHAAAVKKHSRRNGSASPAGERH